MSKFDLKGRVAIVTGGARGCGMAFAQGLAEAGADVAIFDILVSGNDSSSSSFSPESITSRFASEYNVRAKAYNVDVTSLPSLEAAFAAVKADFGGKLDVLVACAGVNANVEFLDTAESDWDRLFGVNCKGVYFAAQLASKAMIAANFDSETNALRPGRHNGGGDGGSIILVASIASYMAIRSQRSSAYCATKGAVRAMVAPIAAEVNKFGIRVNSISPGYVRTEMTAPFPHLMEGWKDEIMAGRVAEPDDIKGACVFLASDASRYCQGSDILVDGGVTKW